MKGKPPMSTYLFKGDPGLYSTETSRIVSAGEPVAGCNSPFFCDPDVYYKKNFDVPADAKYASLQGTCAAVVDMEVVPFALGVLPTSPKSSTAGTGAAPVAVDPAQLSDAARGAATSTVAVVAVLLPMAL
jgi:hypothetical protein